MLDKRVLQRNTVGIPVLTCRPCLSIQKYIQNTLCNLYGRVSFIITCKRCCLHFLADIRGTSFLGILHHPAAISILFSFLHVSGIRKTISGNRINFPYIPPPTCLSAAQIQTTIPIVTPLTTS